MSTGTSTGGKIVVGVDGSEASRVALRWAADEARVRGATLEVVSAWHVPVLSTIPTFGVGAPSEEMATETKKALTELLDEEGLVGNDELTVLEAVVQAPPATALIEASADADLVVVGSRGHGGFKGLLIGSVSQACVSHAACPVVVVPKPDEG
jgi:nucleotide-binding universal stress UspA family protein